MANQNDQIPEDEKNVTDPNNDGAADISGTEAGLESDDDVSKAAENVGLYRNGDEEHPEEVGIGEEVNKAEEIHQEED